MRKKHWVDFILPAILVLSVGILIGVIIRNYIDYIDEIKHLENEVIEAYDKGYLDGENYAIIDLMEDYFDILIENAVLKERLKNQPNNEKHIEQILDDFELLIELQQYYYQENITSHIFWDWLQINYPALYERKLNYY